LRPVYGLDPSLTSFGLSDGTRHIVVKTKPNNELSQAQDLIRRTAEIIDGIWHFIEDVDDCLLVLEAPSLNTVSGGNHLYECGWLMAAIYRSFPFDIIEVPPSSLKLFFAGNGGAGKKHSDTPKKQHYEPCMDCAARDKWGKTFEKDAGRDKRDAFALYAFGVAVEAGTYTHVQSKRRGHEKAEKATRKRARDARVKRVSSPDNPDRKSANKRGK